MRPSSRPVQFALVVLLCLTPFGVRSQEKEDNELLFWGDSRRREAAATAQVVLAQDPYLTLALGFNARRYAVWTQPDSFADKAPALDAHWLSRIRDDSFPPDLSKHDLITKVKQSEWAYRTIYRDALLKAFHTASDVFQGSAGELSDVKWEQMMTNPAFYRGKVVGIHGKLRKLVTITPPPDLRPPIDQIYEAWIQTPTNPRPIVCVFSILPEEFKAHENTVLETPKSVSFVGYYIMRYKYLKNETDAVITPMLIGQSIETGPPDAPKTESGFTIPLSVFLVLGGIFIVVMVLMFGLSRWYKAEDRKIMAKVEQLRSVHNAEMMASGMFQDEPAAEPRLEHGSPERNGSHGDPPAPGEKPPGDSAQAGSV